MMFITAILLAAGEARRMGRLKQLLPFEGRTIVEHIVTTFLSSMIDEVIVVLGCQADRVASLLTSYQVKTVINPIYREGGMLSSIRRGIEEISQQTETACIALGDQPFIRKEIINTLIEAYRHGGKGITVPIYQGQRGHPVLINLSIYREEITTLSSDIGLKTLMLRHGDDLLEVEVEDEAVVLDIDNPEDYEAALRRRVP